MKKKIITKKFMGLAVLVPSDAISFQVYNKDTLPTALIVYTPDKLFKPGSPRPIVIPNGDYQILGKSTELTEEQCAEIMPSIITGKILRRLGIEILYPMVDSYKKSLNAKKAFQSLMQSIGAYSENPYGEEFEGDLNTNGWNEQAKIEKQWQDAQDQTGTWLILKFKEDLYEQKLMFKDYSNPDQDDLPL